MLLTLLHFGVIKHFFNSMGSFIINDEYFFFIMWEGYLHYDLLV